MIDETTISDMLDRLAEAVSSGDLPQISACYAFPGLFMIEEKVIVFEKPAEFEKLFAEGRKWYVGQGIVEAKAEMLRFDPMADTLVGVDVRWPGFDKNGIEVHTETSHYMIQIIGGKPLIRVALSRTKLLTG